MLVHEMVTWGAALLLAAFSVYLLILYLDIFFGRKRLAIPHISIYLPFFVWQLVISKVNILPASSNINITIVITLVTVMIAYHGKFANKCIFVIAFNAVWMKMETMCGYVFMNYFDNYLIPQKLGSVISKVMLLLVILALQKVFTDDNVRELPLNYSIMLVLIPIGSIYIMNNIFVLSNGAENGMGIIKSLVACVILFIINIMIFCIYLKLTEELQLKRSNAVYARQLELYERHQQEREMSMLQFRDEKHNMKNNLVSILAYAENGDCGKVIKFVEELMEDGALNLKTVSNTGNIVIDSLVNYWSSVAHKAGIEFTFSFNIPIQMPFKGADLCLILGNMLENAVEAAKGAENEKYIRMIMKYDKGNLLIFVRNSFDGHLLKTKEGRLKSTKKDARNHGIGLESIHRTAEKYRGTVLSDHSNHEFMLKIILYHPKE